jgi:predicted double-glycine peptidase
MRTLPTLAVLLSCLLFPPAHSADMPLGGILPGGELIRKDVLSMKERKYVNLIRQNTDFSCGAASLATLLRYSYGMDVNEDSVMSGLMAVSNPAVVRARGFSMLNFKAYLEKLGLRGRGYQLTPDMFTKIKVPTLALLNIKGYRHFVVLKRSTDQHMHLADPALGNRIMSRDEFLKAWEESGVIFAVIGKGYEQNSVLLRTAPRVSARKQMDTFRPGQESQLLDFGIPRADLF